MIGLGGAFVAGVALGPLVDAWITRQLAGSGRGRPDAWRPATRWMLTCALGVGWAVIWGKVGWTGVLPAHLVWATVTAALVMTDLEHKLIPNRILYSGVAATGVLLVLGALVDQEPRQVVSAALGAGLCLAGMAGLAALGRGAMGMGDVKLSVLLGLICGYWGVEVALRAVLSGFLIGGVAALVLMLTHRAARHTQIPFAPALVAGAWCSLLGAPF